MRYKQSILIAAFAASLVVANIVAAKIAFIPQLGVAVPAGFIGIGVAFLATDLLGELYGKDVARRTVNAGLAALLVAWGLVYAALWLPPAPFYEQTAAFNAVIGQSGVIVTASILTLLVSQNVDVSVFHALKARTGGRHKWLRNIGSTTISQFVDTVLFIGLAFAVLPELTGGAAMPVAALVSITTGQYLAKLGIVALDTPLFYALSANAE